MNLQGLQDLQARDEDTGLIHVVIDTPKGSRNKFKFEPRLGLFRLGKVLPLGAYFPYDFGYIPSTLGQDGDPVDVLVLMDEPAFPGCVVGVRLIGVIQAEQTQEGKTVRNDRLLGVLETPYNKPPVRSLEELPASQVGELEHFFISYNQAEGRKFRPLARKGPEVADALVREGERQFQESKGRRERQPAAVGGNGA